MKKIEMEKQAKAFGFAAMKFMETKDLEFEHEFRQFCEMNDCGNYGNNYACPPLCGTPEEMEQKVKKYEHALVFQSRTPVQNIFDDAETKIIKKMHTNKTLHAVEELKEQGLPDNGMFIMCGPCNFCEECKANAKEQCVNETMRFSCLSAYCIDAGKMAKHCNMNMEWNGDVVSFFSLYVF